MIVKPGLFVDSNFINGSLSLLLLLVLRQYILVIIKILHKNCRQRLLNHFLTKLLTWLSYLFSRVT